MLISRRVVVTVVIGLGALAGCRGPSAGSKTNAPLATAQQPSAVAPAKSAPQPASPQPVITDPATTPGTAEALAQRAATYAQTVAPLMSGQLKPKPPETIERTEPVTVPTKSAPQEAAPAPISPRVKPADPRAFAANTPARPDVQVTRQALTPLEAAPPAPPQQQQQFQQQPAPAPADSLITALARRAADYPQDLSAQSDNQLGKLLKEESVPDLQSMAGLPPEDRELLGALMDSLTNFRNQLRQNNNMLFSKKIGPLVELGDRLKAQAELAIPTFTFVSQAPAFGVYEKLDPARFIAGKPHTVGVYYEVENFASQLNDKQMYETKLTESIVLYTESSGLPVWTDRKTNLHDLAHRRRHDFFNAKNITLPASLTIGRYLLKVTIEDQQARRIAENTVPVEIVAQ
jgi:hypothetical protein